MNPKNYNKNNRKFIKDVLNKYNIPIEKIDERMTSKLINNNVSKRFDDLSAVKILETYLNNVK